MKRMLSIQEIHPMQIYNPLDAELDMSFVQADGLINGEIYAHFQQAFHLVCHPCKATCQ